MENKKITVVGAGTMGHGIAQACAQKGHQVILNDLEEEILENSMKKIESRLETLLEKKIIEESVIEDTLDRITTTSVLNEEYLEVDFVFETVKEDMEIKKNLFSNLDKLCSPDTILATNTSSLSVTEIAEATKNPERFLGAHWANPPNIMPLVEIIKTEFVSDEVVDKTKEFMKSIDKEPVVCKKDVPLFAVNRFNLAVIAAARDIVERDIASKEDVDKMWTKNLGISYLVTGPILMADIFGLDLVLNVSQNISKKDLELFDLELFENLKEKVEAGNLGLKTGKGYYDYSKSEEEILKERDEKTMEILKLLNLEQS